MPNSMVAERPEVSSARQSTELRSRTRTPYGLPIEDDCASCRVRRAEFFCGFSELSRAALRPIMHVSTYPEGALIVMEGEAARGIHLLCQGRAKLLTTNSEGKTFILKIANAGEVIGLNPILTGMPYDITVETLQPCQLAFIPRDEFLRPARLYYVPIDQAEGNSCNLSKLWKYEATRYGDMSSMRQ